MSSKTGAIKLLERGFMLLAMLVPFILIGLLLAYLRHHSVAVLDPKGEISHQERNLMVVAIILSAVVVLPVYAMTIVIAVKYRESNPKKQKYAPDWDGNRRLETIWWGIPFAIIVVLSIITWQSTHARDPYKPLQSAHPPLHVQVVALDWKWLFIYPDQKIASVNEVAMPVNTPIDFEITSDTVMNSFWIPNLGSQIYAMPGMSTHLHLEADQTGSYRGSSANISGSGFAGMKFTARAMPAPEFAAWTSTAAQAPQALTVAAYSKLAEASKNNHVVLYRQPAAGLYNDVIMQYMMPGMTMQTAAAGL